MPLYDYRCDNGHSFEAWQPITDEALAVCECGAPARRVLHPFSISFRGSGFYNTDYGRSRDRPRKRAKARS
jgi:putative FmdB family regulatory protein